MAFWIPLAAAAAGAMMGRANVKRQQEIEDADRKLAAETERYSWVTGNKAQPIRRAGSMFAGMGQGALSGAMFGSQFAGGASKPTGAEGTNTAMVDPGTVQGQQKSFWHDMMDESQDPNNPYFKPTA